MWLTLILEFINPYYMYFQQLAFFHSFISLLYSILSYESIMICPVLSPIDGYLDAFRWAYLWTMLLWRFFSLPPAPILGGCFSQAVIYKQEHVGPWGNTRLPEAHGHSQFSGNQFTNQQFLFIHFPLNQSFLTPHI